MTQSQTIKFLNTKSGTSLKEMEYEFSPYDAEDDNYIVEIKNRRKNYEDPFLEVNKTLVNLKLSNQFNKQYLYVHQEPSGVYVFNINKLDLDNIYKRFYNVPATTDFENNERVDKEYWVLSKSLAKKIEL